MEDGGEDLLGLRGEFDGEGGGSGAIVDGAGDGCEHLADREGGDVPVCYYYLWRRGGEVLGMQVRGKGGCEIAFTAVAVEADVEGLGQLEAPLGEGA